MNPVRLRPIGGEVGGVFSRAGLEWRPTGPVTHQDQIWDFSLPPKKPSSWLDKYLGVGKFGLTPLHSRAPKMATLLDTDLDFIHMLGRPVKTAFGTGLISNAWGHNGKLDSVVVVLDEYHWVAASAEEIEFLVLH